MRTKIQKYGGKWLFTSAKSGDLVTVEFLLPSYHVNWATREGTSLLSIAARNGHENVVRYLLEKGSDINKANERWYSIDGCSL